MRSFEVNDFEQDVVLASEQQPVLVDFWAHWCGPCRVLGPIVEKLAQEPDVAWTLVKVDTDQHPDLSQRFGIRGIPNLKLFYRGAVVAELPGALPEQELRQWLGEQLPSPAKEALWQGIALVEQGEEGQALPFLQQAQAAGLTDAAVWLAQAQVFTQPQDTLDLLEHAGLSDGENALRTLAQTLLDDPLQGPASPAREPYAAGVEALRNKDFAASLDWLILSVSLDKKYRDELARKVVVAIFQFLGATHPLTAEHRRAFSMALY
ncbi:MAG: tetratricopeptide repeat protein [Bacteroidetes bacterium]|nr:tetratricopeptide repeat protein [Bacteroidota bacterium]